MAITITACKRFGLSASAAALGIGLSIASAANAQSAPAETVAAAQTAPDSDDQYADIIITAQRREQRLQDTPVSVTALSATALEARGIDNLADVSNFAPNLELHPTNRPAGGGSAFAGYIRGVGTGDFQFPTDPGIGLYVDDVYIARSVGGLLSLTDIARIEVLKGPQGTLFGRNTIGGAINVVTVDPALDGSPKGMISARFGSYGRIDGSAAINGPLIDDTLAAKLSVSYLTSRGYGKRLLSGENYGNENRFIVRGAVKWRIAPGVEFKLNGDYTRQRQKPTGGQLLGFSPAGATLAKIARFNAIAAPFENPLLGLPAGSIFDARWISAGPYRNYAVGNQQDDSNIGGVAGVLKIDLAPNVTLKSITAWRNIDALIEVDGDQTPYLLQQSRTALKDNQYSEELQLGGTAFNNRLNFLLGGYLFREEGNSALLTRSFEGIYEALVAANLPATPADVGNTFTTFAMKADSYAFFTQETLKLTDTLSVTLGGRYNHDRKFYSTSVMRPQNNTTVVPLSSAVATSDSFTPKAGIDWKPTRDILIYASYSKGFKSGGFGASTVASTPTPRYDPETLISYEIGAKTSWLDNKLIINAAAFYSKYRNIQLTVQSVDPITNANIRTTRNAGGSDIKGFELEVVAVPAKGLQFNLGAGYVDAKFNSLTAAAITSGFALGSRVPQIPDWSINSGLEYKFDAGGEWSLRGDFTYKGAQLLTPADATSYQKQYALLGARIGFKPDALPGVEFSVEGSNLNNNIHAYYKATLAPTGEYVQVPAVPREIYAKIRFSF